MLSISLQVLHRLELLWVRSHYLLFSPFLAACAISVCLFEGLNSSSTVYDEVLNKKIIALTEDDFAMKSISVYGISKQVD